ncbi:MAG TPA: response regulator transcription factor, partial [Allocoleopsis sp.]
MFMKILVVEDDPSVAQALQCLLTGSPNAVDIAPDGKAELPLSEALNYDLIVLDVILPKLDRSSLRQLLQAKQLLSPLFSLTDPGEGSQTVILETGGCATALQAEADGCGIQVLDVKALIAREPALLQRSDLTNQSIFVWGKLSLDLSRGHFVYGTRLLAISSKEFAILELLLRSSQQALSSQAILDRVGASLDFSGAAAVRVQIQKIRQKLTAAGAPQDFIKTYPRVGYQLNPLYASAVRLNTPDPLTVPQLTELDAVKAELRNTAEQLRLTQAALQQKTQELETVHQIIQQAQQDLKAACDELDGQTLACTTELIRTN